MASLLGLDEVDAIRPVPLTDEEIARQAARSAAAAPRGAPRDHRPKRKREIGNKARRP